MDITPLIPTESCLIPICNCNLEDRVVQDYIRKYEEKEDKVCGPVCRSDIKGISKDRSPDELQAFVPFVIDKVDPIYCYRESDPRISDNNYRTSTKSVLTQMLPLKLLPEKRKEADWGNFQDDSPRVYSYTPPHAKKVQSMMSRFKSVAVTK